MSRCSRRTACSAPVRFRSFAMIGGGKNRGVCRGALFPIRYAIGELHQLQATVDDVQNARVGDDPVNHAFAGERQGAGEDPIPLAEGLVGGEHNGSPLVACGDELEEHARFRLVLGHIGEIIKDGQIELVEVGDGGFEWNSRRAIWSF